jgi:hypothetical protein
VVGTDNHDPPELAAKWHNAFADVLALTLWTESGRQRQEKNYLMKSIIYM